MAYKRLIADVVADIQTGEYDDIQPLYYLLVDQASIAYRLSDTCTDYVFGQQQYGSCVVAIMDIIYDVLNAYTSDYKILAFTLFGYDIPYYLTDCNDNGVCDCGYDLPNERNISSQRLYGVLTNDNYLSKLYDRDYLMQLFYKEETNQIIFSAEHSVVDPPYDMNTYYNMQSQYYKNKLTVTYLSFDRDTGKFAEQIVLDGAHQKTNMLQ